MKSKIPNHIVHYSRAEPFRSIIDVPFDQLDAVIQILNERNSWGLNRFTNQNYFKQRLEVENIVRTKFIEMGGEPILSHPIYFFLGRNQRFEEHPLNIGYVIDLLHLHRNLVSFSYGDTMLSFNEENRKLAGEQYFNPLCAKLFMLDELEDLFENKFFPTQSALAVEAHLWVRPEERIVRRLDR
jgi:hypothetical protein